MATTNFGILSNEPLTTWQRDVWRHARNQMFFNKFAGSDENAMIHRITELSNTRNGARAVITLVHDLEGDGRVGDNQLEENEEAGRQSEKVITLDQMRHAMRHEGEMAAQREVVRFRETARNNLGWWLADRMDQLAFLTLSGISYAFYPNGRPRVGSEFPLLEYAADVTPPSVNRYTRWSDTSGLITAPSSVDNADVVVDDTPSWAMLVDLKAYSKDSYLRPIRTIDGIEMFHVFLTPKGMAHLKKDPDYLANVRNAGPRGPANDLFKGTDTVFVDGLAISEYRYVYNTRGATAGNKWGADGNVDGQRILFCGAQALAFADIGHAKWVEKTFDYDNQPGIAVGKIGGLLKPSFENIYVGNSVEDYGVICCDTAI